MAAPKPARRAVLAAAVAEAPQQAVVSSEVKGLGFYTGDDGYMYCDSLKVSPLISMLSVLRNRFALTPRHSSRGTAHSAFHSPLRGASDLLGQHSGTFM